MLKTIVRWIYGAYAVFAFIVVILLLFCPVLVIAPTLRVRRKIGRFTVRAWLAVIFVPFRVRGSEHLPRVPCVVVSNHASYVDGILLTAALPENFTFMVQHKSKGWPYVSLIIRRMGVSFVNRNEVMPSALSVRRFIHAVSAGESVAIFPEGAFVKAPGLKRFYGGAFVIAAKTSTPVVPVVIRGSRRFLSDEEFLPRWSAITIELFPPIPSTGISRQNALRVAEEVRGVMLTHCGEPDADQSI